MVILLTKLFDVKIYTYIYLSIYIYTCIWYSPLKDFEFLEVAIESWLEWDLNPRPLNSVQTP